MAVDAMRFWVFICALVALSAPAYAKTVTVEPGDGTPIADAVAQLADGDKLIIKKGMYTERLQLTGLSDVRVIGKGKPVLSPDVIATVVTLTSCTRVSVQGIRVVDVESVAFFLNASTDCVVKKCEADNVVTAFRAFSGAGHVFQRNVASNADSGFQPENVDGVTIERCTALEGVGNCVSGAGTTNGLVVRKCKLRAQTGAAIFLRGMNGRYERNTLFGAITAASTQPGDDITGSVFSRNKLTAPAGSGMNITAFGLEVSRNKLDGFQVVGINTTFLAQPVVITRNTIRNAAVGISAKVGESEISRNKIINCERGIDVLNGVADKPGSLFEKNTVKGATDDGIRVNGSGHTFTSNKAKGNTEFDFRALVTEDQNTLDGNRFGTTDFRE